MLDLDRQRADRFSKSMENRSRLFYDHIYERRDSNRLCRFIIYFMSCVCRLSKR
jgi:hypothetical protein